MKYCVRTFHSRRLGPHSHSPSPSRCRYRGSPGQVQREQLRAVSDELLQPNIEWYATARHGTVQGQDRSTRQRERIHGLDAFASRTSPSGHWLWDCATGPPPARWHGSPGIEPARKHRVKSHRTVLSWPSCAGERTSCTTLAASRRLRLKSCSVKMHRCVWGEWEGEAGSDIGCDGVGLGR